MLIISSERYARGLARFDRRRRQVLKVKKNKSGALLRSVQLRSIELSSTILSLPLKRWKEGAGLFSVSPVSINMTNISMPKRAGRGLFVFGDWDLQRSMLSSDLRYLGLRQRYVEGYDWSDTVAYPLYVKKKNGDERRVLSQLESIDRLYDVISSGKLQNQTERGEDPYDEISVNISRDGEILRDPIGATHRFLLAKIAGIDSIPVRVNAVHAWCNLDRLSGQFLD